MKEERIIQAKIRDFLTGRGYLVIKTIACSLNGFPDLTVIGGGKVYFIEVKRNTGILSAIQVAVHKKVEAAGHKVIVARSIRDVQHLQKIKDEDSIGTS